MFVTNVYVIFLQIAQVVNYALDEFFPLSEGVQVIAEPGRFYVAAAYTLAANVHSKRITQAHTMYYINDGVYGSFNCVLYDHAVVSPQPLNVSIHAEFYFYKVFEIMNEIHDCIIITINCIVINDHCITVVL